MSNSKGIWRFKLVFAALIAVSLSLKFLILRSDVAVDPLAVAIKVAALAEARGMTSRLQPMFGGNAVLAAKGACEIGIRAIPPSGELDQSATREFSRFARLRYSFQGSLSPQRPRYWPLITYQWARAMNRMGLALPWTPLLLVGDNGHCPAALLDFGTISHPLHQQVGRAPAPR